jgi:hypothetical protein
MHLRAPSVAAGVSSFLWALVFGIVGWAFMLGIGASNAMAVMVGVIIFCGAFLFVRVGGNRGRLRGRRTRG